MNKIIITYTPEELTKLFLAYENKSGETPKTTEFDKVGLPHIRYYNRAFRNYTQFLRSLGREVVAPIRTFKTNPKRFFYPTEWMNFLNVINRDTHKFWFEFMLHTGMRIEEARSVKFGDIDFTREIITVTKPKGGRGHERTIKISHYLANKIKQYAKGHLHKMSDTFGIPSTPFMNAYIKRYAEKAGIKDYHDFSCHTTRKTLEMWLLGVGVDGMVLSMHQGHTIDISLKHYVSTVLFNGNDKVLIRTILGNLYEN